MANINLLDLHLPYGDRTIKVKAKASGFTDSDFSNSVTYHSAPILAVDANDSTILTISNLRAAVTSYELYINGTLHTTLPYSGADGGSMTVDLDDLTSVPEGRLTISVKGVGTGVESNESNEVSTYYGTISSVVYGVSGLYASSPTLTRTDDAVGMSAVVNSSTGAVSSDFDSAFPWSQAEVVTIGGNKFLKMPDMWFRIGKDSSNRITDVAVSNEQGSTGNWYKVNSFYYGIYGGSVSNSKLASVSGVARQGNTTRAQFRTYAAANGSGYQQLDLYHHTVMMFLWWIEWASKDSQSIMRGKDGSIGGTTVVNTGGTDGLTTPSGYNASTGQMRWHYIEDYIGNQREFVDGTVGSGSTYYVTADPSKFNDTGSGMNTLGYGYPSNASSSNRCISAYGWDSNNPFLCEPKEQTGTDYTIHFCDSNPASNNAVLMVGAYYDGSAAICGVSNCFRYGAAFSYAYYGGRLLYIP